MAAPGVGSTFDEDIDPGLQTPRGFGRSTSLNTSGEESAPPTSRTRRNKRSAAEFEDDEAAMIAKGKLDMLTEKIRWMAFLTHSHDEEDKITKEVYGNKTIENAGEWTAAHIKIGENTRTHKYEYLKALESNIGKVIELHPEFLEMGQDELKQAVYELMNKSTFEALCGYMKGIVDFDRSRSRGKYFIANVYANMFAVGLPYWKLKKDKKPYKDAKDKVHELYKAIALADDHKYVKRSNFCIIEAGEEPSLSKKAVDEILAESYSSAVPPPEFSDEDEEDESGYPREVTAGSYTFGHDGHYDESPSRRFHPSSRF